jgi:hypothetical protein
MARTWIVGALVGALAAVAGIALLGDPEPGVATSRAPGAIAATTTAAASRHITITVEQRIEWSGRALARPLFVATRRPPPAVAERPDPLPRLAGIVIWPGGKLAVFQGEKDARPRWLDEGASVGRWTVSAIAAGSVTMSNGSARIVLHPAFGGGSAPAMSEVVTVAERLRDQWGRHPQPLSYLERRAARIASD